MGTHYRFGAMMPASATHPNRPDSSSIVGLGFSEAS
jgi:hypothetical protein